MEKVIYLNKWNGHVYHVILAMTDGELDYMLASRVSTALEDARRVVGMWRQKYGVGPDNVRDNSQIDLSLLLAGIDPTDFSPAIN